MGEVYYFQEARERQPSVRNPGSLLEDLEETCQLFLRYRASLINTLELEQLHPEDKERTELMEGLVKVGVVEGLARTARDLVKRGQEEAAREIALLMAEEMTKI